ncbi:two-component regulator propeller domain-containing protein [Paroceanicella profunda]|uniref:two-component regulator propeller domain-containing protein n=1 Tax=Paroceanicella profunda TaxID=2579971 RepID=UPI0014782140|nr:two-component regulator propeller domain-containing protein [Paroceanicella profunda]
MNLLLRFLLGALLAVAPSAPRAEQVQARAEAGVLRLPVVPGGKQRFARLSTADGLSQTRVAQILQDDQGFLWMGTQFGLNRYDGHAFRVFAHDTRRPDSMSGMFVTALFKDRDGHIWVATPQALDRFDAPTGTFERITAWSGPGDSLSPTIVHISQDTGGRLWLATGAGLFGFDPGSGAVTRLEHDPQDPDTIGTNDVRWTGEDREGGFWVGTTLGLERLDTATGRVTLRVSLPDPVQISFFEDSAGRFWILHASGDGLALLDRATGRLTRYSFHDTSPSPDELTGVMGMVEDDDGTLWVGSPGMGLMRFDPDAGRFARVVHDYADPASIPENKVIALFKDREGTIWVGHHSVGPSHFNPRPPLFETFVHDETARDTLETNFINAIFEDRQGALWIGNDGGLTRIDRATGRYTRFHEGLGQKPMVITIAQDRQGTIWAGTYGHGLARLDQATGRFTTYRHDPDIPGSLCNNQVHRLFVARDGTFWAGTDDGLCSRDPDTGRFTTYKADWSDRRAQAYVAIAEDRDGTLWLGTHYSGLHRFDPATGRIDVYRSVPGQPGSLRDNMVPAVHVARDGTVWVGTQGGLDRFDRATGTFTPIYESADAPGRTVSRILEDAEGTLWISSNRGLLEYDPAAGTFRSYSAADGLPGDDLTGWSSAFHSPSGEMFFGGFTGGIAFFPEALKEAQPAPPVALTDLRFPYLPAREAAALTGGREAGFLDRLTLPAGANSFSLSFSALSYLDPATNRTRYRLEGLDDQWRTPGDAQRAASFTTLPAGDYVFRVQGATARSDWSAPGIALPIRILPPWWETWWFRGAAALATLGLILAGLRLRIAQVAGRERDFRKLAENAPDMVLRIDPALHVRYANPRALAFASHAQAGLTGNRLADIPPDCMPVRRDAVVRALLTGEPVDEEFTLERPGGTVTLDCRVIAEPGGPRAERTVLVIARDITRRKQTEMALRKSQADLVHATRVVAVGELTATIAHEINQPLTAIVTNGEAGQRWLRRDPPDYDRLTTTVEQIVRDGRRAAAIVRRICTLVRRAETERRPVDINDAILELRLLVEGDLRRNAVNLGFDLDPHLPRVEGDRVQIQQVVLNLLKNAMEAMRGESGTERRIRVVTRTLEGAVEILVADTGTGIPAPASGDIFSAFYTTRPQGMGLGLTVSRSIATAHGGSLRAEPAPGGGTVFRLALPALPGRAAPA